MIYIHQGKKARLTFTVVNTGLVPFTCYVTYRVQLSGGTFGAYKNTPSGEVPVGGSIDLYAEEPIASTATLGTYNVNAAVIWGTTELARKTWESAYQVVSGAIIDVTVSYPATIYLGYIATLAYTIKNTGLTGTVALTFGLVDPTNTLKYQYGPWSYTVAAGGSTSASKQFTLATDDPVGKWYIRITVVDTPIGAAIPQVFPGFPKDFPVTVAVGVPVTTFGLTVTEV